MKTENLEGGFQKNSFKLLDLFSGAGGAARGYQLAGFYVVGVDINKQPHYIGNEFHQADALEYLAAHGHEFDAIHASPVCKGYTNASLVWRARGKRYPDQIAAVRDALIATGKPYVIENVKNAPLRNPTVLNGAMFGLKVARVRYFECSFPVPFLLLPPDAPAVKMGRPVREGDVIQPVGHFSNVAYARREMEIDWMTGAELTQAIPPAYTEYIGHQLMNYLEGV